MTDRGAYKSRTGTKVPAKLSERIRAWRLHFGYTQSSLAVSVGVKRVTVIAWEKGQREPSGSAMLELVRVLGISEHALRTGEGFELPLLPPTGHLGWPDAGGGDLMAVEENTKVPVVLPTAHPGEVWGLEISTGLRAPLSPEKALEWLQAALDEDRVVWIVTKSSGGLKATRRLLERNPK